MSRGIAQVFRQKFGMTDLLEQQEPAADKMLHVERNTRYLFYPVSGD